MVSGGRQGRLLLLKSVKEVGYVRERAVFVLEVPQLRVRTPYTGDVTAVESKPESTEAMGRGVDTRDDGQGKANGASPIPIDGDEGGVR